MDPFSTFFNGGFGGGFGGFESMGGPPRKKGDNTILYKQLGLDTKATQEDIKREYRKLARKWHPDRNGGNDEKFKEIQNAYDVLSNEEKRKAYDATGDPNADPNMVNGRRKRKGKSTTFELELPLEHFYTGHQRQIHVTKTVICARCTGKGGTGVTQCQRCRGQGNIIVDRRLGGNMIQRMRMECDVCSGKGEVIPESGRCVPCAGKGVRKESKVLTVDIAKGMKHNEKVVFSEEGDQHPDEIHGDIVVILKQVEHKTFTRTPDGCHLMFRQSITLLEALTGFQFAVTHLDGRSLIINSEPGAIYKDGDVKAIKEEGFPVRGGHNGHLYITLNLVYPQRINQDTKAGLISLLGPARQRPELKAALDLKARQGATDAMDDGNEVSEVNMVTVDVEAEKAVYKRMMQENRETYESDDEQQQGPQEVGCRQA